MSPNVIQILLNLGKIIGTAKDLEQAIADLVAGKPIAGDAKKVMADLSALLKSGLIHMPGMGSQAIEEALLEIEKIL